MTPALKTRDETQEEPDETRIALDMDGVLAATKERVWDLLGVDVEPRFMTHWEWPKQVFGDAFLDTFEEAWTHNVTEIDPVETGLAETTQLLASENHVDVVTAQPSERCGVEGKKQWLDHHDISYNQLVAVAPGNSKASLDYDVYIDDKPDLVGTVTLDQYDADVFLVDKPYNEMVLGEHERVDSVADTVSHLVDRDTILGEVA